MSRFLLLFLFLIWLGWRSNNDVPASIQWYDLSLFIGLYVLMVATLGIWSRLLAKRVGSMTFRRSLRYFNRVVFAAQMFIPIWFAVGLFYLGWGSQVQRMMGPINRWPVQTPAAIVGTLPGLLAWIGLWWSQYPADRALREQNLLVRIERDLPIFTSPSLGEYFQQNFRLQVLFTALPIVLILLAHDVVMVLLTRVFRFAIENNAMEGAVSLCTALGVFIIVPGVLYRVLGARRLPDSPLRERMESMCRMHRLKFRDILLWPTHNRIANALVMGVTARFRYVLLSDLLLAEMSDEQIEAVFAHELGHVKHRHMVWYLVFMWVLILALSVAGVCIEIAQKYWLRIPGWVPMDVLMIASSFGAFVLAFGYVSRRFERQADVFAARTLQRFDITEAAAAMRSGTLPPSHVGQYGATIFASALERVAYINNMPIGAEHRFEGGPIQRLGVLANWLADLGNNWLHGSISTRMKALMNMSDNPVHTRRFDKYMARLYITLLTTLVVSGALAWLIKPPA